MLYLDSCFSDTVEVKADNLVKTFYNWGPEFGISFGLKVTKPPSSWITDWYNFLHLTTGANNKAPGTRVPGVWLSSDSNGKPFMHVSIFMVGDNQLPRNMQ